MKMTGILANKLTTVVSKLGDNSDSILPILAKDITQDTATTLVYTKKGGEHDGKEKAIEEYGTGIIWIAGIPTLKKIFDKTIYKIAKINPNIDVRKLKDAEYVDNLKYTMSKFAQDSKEYLEMDRVLKHPKLAKGLFISKFVVATAATIGLLGGLIKIKQKTTEKNIQKKIAEDNAINYSLKEKAQQGAPKAFAPFKGLSGKNNPSFKGIGAYLSEFMYNPVKNMSILDAAISGTRLKDARKGERGEVLFKEASAISFFYALGRPIQRGLEKLSARYLKTPINLDIKTFVNPEFEKSIQNGTLKKGIKEMLDVAKDDKALLDYIWNPDNANNIAVKLLKETGEIPTIKESVLTPILKKFDKIPFIKKLCEKTARNVGAIDYGALMEPEVIKESLEKIGEFAENAVKSPNLKKTMNRTKALKVVSIFANIGIAVLWLGILQPLLAINARKVKHNGSNENPAITEVKKNLETQMCLK